MTLLDLVERLAAHRKALPADVDADAFQANVDKFLERLAMIQDGPPGEMSQAIFDQVSSLADQVIEEIEQRLYDGDDSPRLKRHLAEAVYAIRREIEEVFRWRRHFKLVK